MLYDVCSMCPMIVGRSIGTEPVDVAAGTAFALLVALAGASKLARDELSVELVGALAEIGDNEGEPWLNLFGIPLDAGPPYGAERLVEELRAMDAVELRRHLLGRFAWSWCTVAGTEDIESAATGDRDAARRLLANPRYYAGHAESLATLLDLDPEESRTRIVRAVEAGARSLLSPDARERLTEAAKAAAGMVATGPPLVAIEQVTTGYRYTPEPEAERVVLIPHLDPTVPLVLAQHRSARLVVYRAGAQQDAQELLLAFGRAVADPKRVEILALIGRGLGRAQDLVEATQLSRSTVHHHLAQLREAGLVALEGNARAYTYVARREAAARIAALVAEIVETKEEA
jgi:DNA-binding transcriptional ArsR family regulator